MSKGHPVIAKTIAASAGVLEKLTLKIHAHPELGHAEHKACRWQVSQLAKWGFDVETPLAGLDTAYRAVIGSGEPTVCFMGEYDALPELGHACGHNLICTTAMGAGRALAAALKADNRPGRVIVMGTPAEESDGGKVALINGGAMTGFDLAMMAHPSGKTFGWNGCTAVQSFTVTFQGRSAHAAAAPTKGLNALDAVRLLFSGIDAWRQQLPESSRIHGIITDGGAAPNIIPDRAEAFFYIRSPKDDVLVEMVRRFENMVKGAELMTDTTAVIKPKGAAYKAPWVNETLNAAYVDQARAAGLKPVATIPPGRGSTDFSDVSQLVPGLHGYFAVGPGDPAAHSPAFAVAAGKPTAVKNMLRAAEALANVGYRFVTEPDFRKAVQEEFETHRQG